MSMNLTQTTTTCDVYDLGCSNQDTLILKYYFNQALQRKKWHQNLICKMTAKLNNTYLEDQ